MRRIRLHLVWLSLFLLALAAYQAPTLRAAEPPVVILKLDDFRPGGAFMPDGWQLATNLLAQRGIKASYGIIGRDLVRADSEFCDWIRRQHESGRIEFWNHGYLHAKRQIDGKQVAEFQLSYADQLEMLRKMQELGQQKLGITFTVFGAPYNAINADTARALAAVGDIDIWLYGNARIAAEGGFEGEVLRRVVNLESPVHQPNFQAFKERYQQGDLGPCLVLQGHPQSWASERERFRNFVQIIDFLQQQGCQFMTPSEYVASRR